ncbi:MAG TPA: alpha/beta hydrolase [Steroidobacteraceae bacterium]|jgi:pimeloyl-ACP methyl ester carboxylesterase
MDELRYVSVRANGLQFNVAEAGSGDRLALLLHGFPECAYSWRHQLPLLAQLGYRVWAPDLRGYGGTSRPQGVAAYALPELEADVQALIEASGASEVLLIGHDWGAAIAWSYAMFGKRPVQRLIIMNVPHPELMRRGLSTFRQLKKSWYIFFFQLPWLPERMLARRRCAAIGAAFKGMAIDKSRFPKEVLDVYRRQAAIPGALTAMLNYYRALLRGFNGLKKRGTRKIDIPTLMIWGEEDSALGKELTYGTERYVSDLKVRYLPRVSHWVQQEAPETVNAIIQAWLAGETLP